MGFYLTITIRTSLIRNLDTEYIPSHFNALNIITA